MGYKEELDKMTWSFSRIHAFETCPYAFYLRYIEEEHGDNNFYAENGKIMHKIFEDLLSKKLDIDDCTQRYTDDFDDIENTVKRSTMDKTFDSCIDYLSVLDFDRLKNYDVLGVELEIKTKIDKYNFTGYIDMLVQDKVTKEIIIIDHKSSKYMLKKNGDVLKGSEIDFLSYKHQMYLYCKYVYEKFGKYPKKIVWNHFKDNKLCVIDFDEKEFKDTIKWARDTIKQIYKETDYLPKKSYMMCYSLCNFRNDCYYKEEGD